MSENALVADSRAVLARHARSFRLASIFLPARTRDDAAVVYAFCRMVDDIADEGDDPAAARVELLAVMAELRGEIEARPLVALLRQTAARLGMELRAAEELVEGALSDLEPVRIADEAALERYCYLVAGTVGVLMCGVLGVTDPVARSHAVALGVGMQITNICRDVVEDAARGRVYLPATALYAGGLSPEQILNRTADGARLSRVVRALLGLADERYGHAFAGMVYIPVRTRAAILVAAHLYRGIGLRLLRIHQGDPLHGRTIMSTVERAQAVLAGLVDWARLGLSGSLSLR